MAKIRYPNLRQKIDILNLIFQTPFGYDILHKFSGYSKRQSPRCGGFAVRFLQINLLRLPIRCLLRHLLSYLQQRRLIHRGFRCMLHELVRRYHRKCPCVLDLPTNE